MDILHQDKRILIAIKPAGVLSTDEPGGMPSLLRSALGDDKACVRTVHRLDAAVQGVMVFARSAKAASLLSEQVRGREFEKEYLAVVHGMPPVEGTLCDLLGRDTVRRTTYVADAPGKDVREAKLSYRVLQRCEGYSLVSICLHTGRTHQIRVQFASRGWPLAGDRKYGIEDGFEQIALWSHRIAFFHPETGERVEFSALSPHEGAWALFSL